MTTGTVGYLAFLLLAIYLFLRYVMGYVMPFVIGVALALLLEPVVKFFTQRFRLKRAAAAALTVLGLIAILALILSWGITRIAAEPPTSTGDYPITTWISTRFFQRS